MGCINGAKAVLVDDYLATVSEIQQGLFDAWSFGLLLPCSDGSRWARHVVHELNTRADALAAWAIEEGSEILEVESGSLEFLRSARRCRITFDGAVRQSAGGSGWMLYASEGSSEEDGVHNPWKLLASCSFPIRTSVALDSDVLARHDALRHFFLFLGNSRC